MSDKANEEIFQFEITPEMVAGVSKEMRQIVIRTTPPEQLLVGLTKEQVLATLTAEQVLAILAVKKCQAVLHPNVLVVTTMYLRQGEPSCPDWRSTHLAYRSSN